MLKTVYKLKSESRNKKKVTFCKSSDSIMDYSNSCP